MTKHKRSTGRQSVQMIIAMLLAAVLSLQLHPVRAEAAVLQQDIYPEWRFSLTSHVGDVSQPISRLRLDGREVFCVQVDQMNADGEIYPDPIPASEVYNPEMLNRLGLITLFGFELTGRTKLDVAFTKLFVYETIGYTNLELIDYSGANAFTMSAYEAYKARIESQIQAYMSRTSFHGQTIRLTAGQPLDVIDEYGVLQEYHVLSAPSGVSATAAGSTLTLTAAADAESGQVVLQRSVAEQGTSLLYQPPGRQAVIESKIDAPRQSVLSLSVVTTGGFTLAKQKADGSPLGGAVFRLTAPDGTGQDLTVPSEGVSIDQLPAGEYLLEEIEAPPGYRLDSTIRTITVRAGEMSDVNVIAVTNEEEKGRLCIVKKSADGGTIAGARFEISRAEDFAIIAASGETAADGTLVLDGLSLAGGDSYFIRETHVPHPYVLDTTVRSVQLKDSETVECLFENDIMPWRFELKKTDEDGNPIPGAVFLLSQSEDFADARTLTTDAEGQAMLSGTDAADQGGWFVREESVPAPFLLDQTVHAVELACGETASLNVMNDMAAGSIALHKSDQETGVPLSGARYRMAHTESDFAVAAETDETGAIVLENLPLGNYEVTEIEAPEGYVPDDAVHRVSLNYRDQLTPVVEVRKEFVNRRILGQIRIEKREAGNGQPIAGAAFIILDEDGVEAARLVTGTDGSAESEALPYGRYLVREIDRPAAFYDDPFETEVRVEKDGELITVDVTNERILIQLQVRKTCAESDQPLAGARFEILDAAGERVPVRDDAVDPYMLVTDNTGRAWTDLTLGIGVYRLVEIVPPPGYATSQPQTFEIGRDTEHVVLESGGRLLETNATNAPTIIDILKTDELGRVLPGALLTVENESGQVVAIWHSGLTARRLTRLTAGETYTVRELSAPAGFVIAKPFDFIVADTSAVQVVTCKNEPTEMIIDKRDRATGEPLAGMVFEIRLDGEPLSFRDAGGGVYRMGGSECRQVTTGEDGLARIQGLPAGLYEIVETAAPGFRLADDARFADLKGEHGADSPYRLEWFNDALRISVIKIDADTNVRLSGVHFTIEREGGDVLTFREEDGICRAASDGSPDLVTDETGRFTILGLPPGHYICREAEPPVGYFEAEPVTFTVTDRETADIELQITNKQVPLPVTGDAKTWPLVGTLLVLNGAGIVSIRVLLRDWRQRRRR